MLLKEEDGFDSELQTSVGSRISAFGDVFYVQEVCGAIVVPI